MSRVAQRASCAQRRHVPGAVVTLRGALLGANPTHFGYVKTTFTLLQLLGGPVIGRVCDARGGRAAMLISLVGAVVGCACAASCAVPGGDRRAPRADTLLGSTRSVAALFLSQLPLAFTHVLHSGQALISDMTGRTGRVRAGGAAAVVVVAAGGDRHLAARARRQWR